MRAVTDYLELLGALLLVAAAAVFVGGFTFAGGLATAGLGLIALSFILLRAGNRKAAR